MQRFILSLTTLLLVPLLLPAMVTAQQKQTLEIRGRTMGPIAFSVRVVTDVNADPEKLDKLPDLVNEALQRINELMSTYIEDSDISKFNRSTSTDWQSVDLETATVVAKSLKIGELTGGAFDPTVAPAVNAWNFGPEKKERPSIPGPEVIAKLKSTVGLNNIEARLEPPAIRKTNPQTRLDLSAIAKGYAVDRVARTLESHGYDNFMVEVGGEVRTQGQRVSGDPWNVAIEKPENSDPTVVAIERAHRVVALSNRSVATSGNYRNFHEIDGQRYSHTIDPATCKPVTHPLAIASVIADDCMTADAMATAVMVLGREKGAALCKKLGYPLLTVQRSKAAEGTDYVTDSSADFPLKTIAVEGSEETSTSELGESARSILPVFAATFVIFCLMVLGMAIGAIFNNKPVTGSCGGIANMTNEDGESVCGICSKPTTDCERTQTAS